MNEKQKMCSGLPYDPLHPTLILARDRAARILFRYNRKTFHEIQVRHPLMRKLIHTSGHFWVKPPFFCDYGFNITLGHNVMLNAGCVLLDVCPILIQDHTLIGPGVHIYTACHSLDPQERRNNLEYGQPVTLGRNVWIGGRVTICPGVTIGDNAVIGAGSVVTRSIPAGMLAVGNPCRVVRPITARDRIIKE